jgi:D-galactose 1-dehydrogenase
MGGFVLAPYSIAIIGVGKIARDQHLPVIAKNPRFRLAGVVSHSGARAQGVPSFHTAAEAYAALPDLDAVVICTPPSVRHALAREALDAGKHVMLEKPPAPTMAEMHDLTAYAAERGRVVFATWHSQYNAAVDEAKRRLAGAKLRRLAIEWKEDVRRWHPGQEWIWDAGNFGVFDPGVNALSILSKIAPGAIFVKSAELLFPANRDTPIAASLVLVSPAADPGAQLTAAFDWRRSGGQTWRVDIDVVDGPRLSLVDGGAKLLVDGRLEATDPTTEYADVYARFAELLARGESVVDSASSQLVADAFRLGERKIVEPFHW